MMFEGTRKLGCSLLPVILLRRSLFYYVWAVGGAGNALLRQTARCLRSSAFSVCKNIVLGGSELRFRRHFNCISALQIPRKYEPGSTQMYVVP